ncbi:hypothetical protein SORBI_3002G416950 [Sorghum bicolor]|uniref:Uncharacterized protein n=1 Tax=Sorghum bicolor TaxID=4558 RepID=A0A1W0W7T9_SORBI|nr:hypothetical protein SORBI_3002G416950 [Sorghum bicolor]
MASKSLPSPAARRLLFLAVTLMLAASVQAQGRTYSYSATTFNKVSTTFNNASPATFIDASTAATTFDNASTTTTFNAHTPPPPQDVCPTGFTNSLEYDFAFRVYAKSGIRLQLGGSLMSTTTCYCNYSTISFGVPNINGPIKCHHVST